MLAADPLIRTIAEWKHRQLEQYEYDHLDNGKGGIDDVGIQEIDSELQGGEEN